jgi:hypothetical protein
MNDIRKILIRIIAERAEITTMRFDLPDLVKFRIILRRRDTDQGMLSACSTIPPPIENAKTDGPCLITPVNENGNFAGQNNIGFVTGRP